LKPSGDQGLIICKKDSVVIIGIGVIMHWQADDDSDLEVHKICFQQYDPGQFKNLS